MKPSKYLLKSEHPEVTRLTIGRNTHIITEKDRFLDNGHCVQLVKELPMKVCEGEKDSHTLNDEQIEHLKQFTRVEHNDSEFHRAGHGIPFVLYSIKA